MCHPHCSPVAQALDSGKLVIVLDLQDESDGSKRNNAQIKQIMKTLQLMPFSSDTRLAKGLMAGVVKIISGKLGKGTPGMRRVARRRALPCTAAEPSPRLAPEASGNP